MNKREKILVFASVAAAVWGAIVILNGPVKTKDGGAGEGDTQQFVASIAEQVKASGGTSLAGYDISMIMGNRISSPFLPRRLSARKQDVDLVYNGYVRSGHRMFALINKKEYKVGDIVEGTFMQVKNIDPCRVVLAEGMKKKRILPLEGGLK